MTDILEFTFRDPSKNKMVATIEKAVRRDDFRRSQTRWRRFSFTLAAIYCSHVYLISLSSSIKLVSALGLCLCLGCIFPSKFGRLKYPD